MSFDPLEALENETVSTVTGARQPLKESKVTKKSASQVTTHKKLVRGRGRKTIWIPPAQEQWIAEMAARESIFLMDAYNWLLSVGQAAYEAGQRPQTTVEHSVSRVVIMEHDTAVVD